MQCILLHVPMLTVMTTLIGKNEYSSKNGGRKIFQIDMAIQLIDFGIRQDWVEPFSADTKPPWIRQRPILPCDCKSFFCKTGMTNGTSHIFSDHPVQQQEEVQEACKGGCNSIWKNPQECLVCCFVIFSNNPNEPWKDARKMQAFQERVLNMANCCL